MYKKNVMMNLMDKKNRLDHNAKKGANIEIGELEKLSYFDLTSKIVQQKMKERYGENFPVD